MADAFIDEYLPAAIQGMPCRSSPRFSTRIVLSKSGDEGRNQSWKSPLRRFVLPEAVGDQEALEAALDFWLIMGGPFHTWPFRDPFDFASVALEEPNVPPSTSGLDQALGAADGTTWQYQLVKRRQVGAQTYDRPIYLPVLSTIHVLMDGVAPAAASGGPYTVSISRPGGVVSFSPVPQAGLTLTWGGLYDTEVRWEADTSFDAIIHSLDTIGAAEIDLVEVRRC